MDPTAFLDSIDAPAARGPAAVRGKFTPDSFLDSLEDAPVAAGADPEQGDFVRGAKVAAGQMIPLAKGAAGLVGATAEKIFGEGGVSTKLKDWGLQGYQEGMKQLEPMAKETDELTTAWERAQAGDIGALVDWAQYGLGYSAAQLAAAAGTSIVGGVAGGAVAGPAGAVAGAAGGAVEGAIGGGVIRSLAQKAIGGMVEKEVARMAATAAGRRMTEDAVKRAATAQVAKTLGQRTALFGYAGVQEGGSIYGEAEEQAAKDGRQLDGADLARVWGTTAGAALLESVTDKLGLDVLSGKVRLPGAGGRVARGGVGAAAVGAGEAATEAGQTALERYGAGKSLIDDEAKKDYINSAALGALGGAAVGGAGGAIHSPNSGAVPENPETGEIPGNPGNSGNSGSPVDPITGPMQTIAAAGSVDEAIQAATSSLDAAMRDAGARRVARQAAITAQSEQEMMATTQQRRDAEQVELDDLIASESQNLRMRRGFALVEQQAARQRALEEQAIVDQSRATLGTLPDQQVAAAGSADQTGQPTAMQLAMQRARQRLTAKPKTETGDWRAFTPETGTIGIPRAEMPQIKAEHRGALTNFLNARGVQHQEEMVEPGDLKPTQAEYSPAKVQQALGFTGGNRAILVSRDGHVLDGHHQLLAAQQQGIPVRVIRLDAPIQKLVGLAHEFPSSAVDQSSEQQNRAPAPDQQAQAAIKTGAQEGSQNAAALPVRPSGQAPAAAAATPDETPAASQPAAASTSLNAAQQRAADADSDQAPMFSRADGPAAKAADILDAAGVTGKERIDALMAVKSGALTADELKAAYPAAANDQIENDTVNPEERALQALAENSDLFALPKSEATSIEDITAETDPAIKVKSTADTAGRTEYKFTMPDGTTASMAVRKVNPYASDEIGTVYGFDMVDGEMTNLVTERPGNNPEQADGKDDVWIDVSRLKTGGAGAKIYNIAETFAHNTGRIFIGDPAGLSDAALRRRTEQMLSSALKFGTTEHLAPHPRQVRGDASLGVPPLNWTYGDDPGNIRSLIDVSVSQYANDNPITFEPSTGRYLDSEGVELDDDAISLVVRVGRSAEAGIGITTAKRNAVLNSLVRDEGGQGSGRGRRDGLLESLVGLAGKFGSSTREIFYARDGVTPEPTPAVRNPSTVASVQAAVSELIGGKWLPNKLGRVVATTASEIKSHWEPQIGQNVQLGSEGEAGQAQAFYDPRSRTVFLIADNIPAGDEIAVAAHELMHKHGQAVLGKDGWDKLHGVISTWADAPEDSDERAVYDYASARVRAVGEELSSQELFPYAVEAAIKMGIKPSLMAKKGTVARWLASVKFAMQQAWGKLTGKPEAFKTQDLVDLAFGIAQMENPDSAAAIGGALKEALALDGGAQAATKTIATDTPAFKRWFGDSKVVDADGKPLVVYHGTTADFSEFKTETEMGAHFGTAPQANSMAISSGNVMPSFLSLKNPLRMQDRGDFSPGVTVEQLADLGVKPTDGRGFPSFAQLDAMTVADATKELQAIIEGNGYDGIVYLNRREGLGTTASDPEPSALEFDDFSDAEFKKTFPGAADSYIAFRPEQIKSAIGNNGDFDPANSNIAFSRNSLITGQPLLQAWQAPDATRMDDFIYSIQDKHVDTKRVVQAVRDSIGQIADNIDPYLQEELYHGRSAKATKDFLETGIRPLLTDMQARGVDISDFEEYLHNRHAERRNVQVAKVNPAMPDGGSGIATADARVYLAGLPAAKRRAYEVLAKRVDQINRETRALLVSSGLEKQETIDAWDAAYGDEYVPLMREEMDGGAQGIGQGFSVKGGSSKRAMGSNKPVADIIANIALQREKAITRAEKKRIGEALYGMVLSAPNPDFWFAVDPELQKDPAQIGATAQQLMAMGLSPADADSIASEPKQRYIDPRTGQVAERINPALRAAENVLAVRIDGEDKFVFFNARDPRAMRMAKSLKNLDADQLGEVMGTVAKMTRYFSAINTQYNPIFGVVNVTRDIQAALLNLQSTPLKGKQAEVSKLVLPALRGIYIDLRDRRAGKPSNSVYAQLWEEFQNEGGATGYKDMYANAKDRAEAIADELQGLKDGTLKKAGKGIMGWLSDYNDSMENAVRVVAYKVGKDSGLTNQQAASIAKNLTTNFNRKGQVALQAGALWAFFNASVQGTARIGQTMFRDGKLTGLGKRILTGGLMLGSMQAMLLAAAGFDDDEPPDFVRERSLVLPIGDSKYISIPMPLGFHVLPNLSRIPTEWALGGFKDTPKRLAQLVGLFADAFNPIGSAGLSLQTLTPTIIDPLAALAENKDFTGKPIAKKDFNSMQPTAGHTRAKDTATPWGRAISYAVNWLTGGTDFKPGVASPTPDQIDYLIGQVTGGVGREVSKLGQMGESAITGEELPLYKIPLVGRFVGTTEGQAAASSRFYNNLKKIGEHDTELKGLKSAGRAAEYREYLADHPEAVLAKSADQVYRDIRKLVKAKREAVAAGVSRERVQLMEMQISSRMTAFNNRVKAIEERVTEGQ